VLLHAEIVGFPLVSGRQGAIDWHAADSADGMVRRLVDGDGELGVGIRVQLALALIFEQSRSLARYIPTEVWAEVLSERLSSSSACRRTASLRATRSRVPDVGHIIWRSDLSGVEFDDPRFGYVKWGPLGL